MKITGPKQVPDDKLAAVILACFFAILGISTSPAYADSLLDLLRAPNLVAPGDLPGEPCEGIGVIPLDGEASNSQLSIHLDSYCVEAGLDRANRLTILGRLGNVSPDKAMSLLTPSSMLVLQLSGGVLAPSVALDPLLDERFTARPLQPLDRRKFTVSYYVPEDIVEATLIHPAQAGVLALPVISTAASDETTLSSANWLGLSMAVVGVAEAADLGGEVAAQGRRFVTISLRVENQLADAQAFSLGDFVEAHVTTDARIPPAPLHSTFAGVSTFFPKVPVHGALTFEVDDEAGVLALIFDDGSTSAELPLAASPKSFLSGPISKAGLEFAVESFDRGVNGEPSTVLLWVTNRQENDLRGTMSGIFMGMEDGRYGYPVNAVSGEGFATEGTFAVGIPNKAALMFAFPPTAQHLALAISTEEGVVSLPLTANTPAVDYPVIGEPGVNDLLTASLRGWSPSATLTPPEEGSHYAVADLDIGLTDSPFLTSLTFDTRFITLLTANGRGFAGSTPPGLAHPIGQVPIWAGRPIGGEVAFLVPEGTPLDGARVQVGGAEPAIVLPVDDLEPDSIPVSLTFESEPVRARRPITINFEGMPENREDWLSIASAGSPDDTYIEAISLGGARSGRAVFNGFSEGDYELRAYFNWPDNGYRVERRIPFSVAAAPPIVPGTLLKLPRPEITSSDPVTIVWDEFPGFDRDWISIAAVGVPDTSDGIDDFALRGRTAGRLMFAPLPAGDYEARAYFNGGRDVQDRITFKVVAPAYEHHIRDDSALPGLVNVAHLERGAFIQAGPSHDLLGDGNAIDYGNESTFARLGQNWPSRIWLAHPYPIERVRFLLWDIEPRSYRYVLKGTSDGVNWVTLRDQTAVPVAGGWQEIETGGETFVAFSLESTYADGIENGFALVEFAAYTKAAAPDPAVRPLASDMSEWIDRVSPVPLNVALPALGATADAKWGGEHAINGMHDGKAAEASAARPLLVTLSNPFPIEAIRIETVEARTPIALKVEGSADGVEFFSLADHQEPRDGLTEIDVGGRVLQVLRVTPLLEGDAEIQVWEVEMFASGVLPIAGVTSALPAGELTANRNLALTQNGGRIAVISSERMRLAAAHNLIDGRLSEGWQSGQPKFPEEVVIVLGGRPGALVDAVDFYSGNDNALPRLVDIAVASEAGEWSELGRYALSNALPAQRVSFEPLDARLVRIRFAAGYHGDRVGLGEIAVRETQHDGYDSVSITHWPGFDGGLNIAAAALGGSVVYASPIDPDPNYPVSRLIDGYDAMMVGAWALDTDPAVAQVTIGFAGDRTATIAGMAFNPDGGYSNFTGAQRWTSMVEVWTSTTASDSGFEWVGRYRLDQSSETQIVSFAPRQARYVRVLLLDTFGSPGAVLGEIEILEAPGLSVTDDRPPNLLDMSYGGHLAVPAGTNRSYLIDSSSATEGWYDQTGARPVELTFAFDQGAVRTFDAVGLNPRTALDPATWATRAKVLVSDHPLRDFQLVADVEIEPVDRLQYFPIGPTTARYVQVRLLDNGGDPIMSLGEVAVREVVPEGQLSVVARREDAATDAVEAEIVIVPLTGAHSEQEPNNTRETATNLPFEESMVGEISPLTDEDWYTFDASGVLSGAVNARIEEQPTLQSELSLYAEGGTLLGTQALYDTGRPSQDFTWLTDPESYNLKLGRAQNSIVFIVDRSDSVSSARGAIAVAAERFAQTAGPDDAISFATMDGEVFNDFTTDKAVLEEAARRTGTGSGGSAFYGSLSAAMDRLMERKGAKAIVIVTDGEDSGSSMEPLFSLWDRLRGANVRIYTVGFGRAATWPLEGMLASTGGDMLREFSAATAGKFFLAPSGAAMRDIYSRISRDLRSESGYRLTLSPAIGTGQLQVVAEGEEITGVGAPRQVGLVFDASGSMKKVLEGGVSRMDVARQTLNALVDRLPDTTEVSLTVYGHRLPSKPHEASCRDIELLMPFSPLDRDRMHAIIDGIKPRGETPIGRSLLAVAQSFEPTSSKKFVILITDGEESCDPDPDDPAYPPRVIEALRSQGIELTLSIVGFAIGDEPTRAFLQDLAEGTGGGYYDAADQEALDDALKKAFSADFTAFDSLGIDAATGRVGGEAVPLPEGAWRIILQSDPSIDLGVIKVTPGDTTTVVLTKEGDRLDIRSSQ